jgi:hypothetical protein
MMKKERIFMKLLGRSLAATAIIALAGAAASSSAADMDMAGMMAEGIPYECAEARKCIAGPNDNRADMEALMAEGIGYADSVVAADKVLIKLDHRQALLQGRGACLCEGPPILVAGR